MNIMPWLQETCGVANLKKLWSRLICDGDDENDPVAALGAALVKAASSPGRLVEAQRHLSALLGLGVDPRRYVDAETVQRIWDFWERYQYFAHMANPDLTTGGWATSSIDLDEGGVAFAYRTFHGNLLHAVLVKDFKDMDVVQAAVGFSEVDLHPLHVEGLVESRALAELSDAALWVQVRETVEEIVQVEMVNALDEPLHAVVHMYYSVEDEDRRLLFHGTKVPEPKKARCHQNYKQCVTFTPMPKGGVRAHFAFIMELDPRIQQAITNVPSQHVLSVLSKAFSVWPASFEGFQKRYTKVLSKRESASSHAAFYVLCRDYLEGRQLGGDVFYDVEEGDDGKAGGAVGAPESSPEPAAKGAQPPARPSVRALLADQDQLWEAFDKEALGSAAVAAMRSRARRPSAMGVTIGEYAARNCSDYEKLKALESNDGWDFLMTEAGVDVYTPRKRDLDEAAPVKYFKGIVRVKTYGHGVQSLVKTLNAHESRPQWDDICLAAHVVEDHSPYYHVAYFKLDPGSQLVALRDLVIVGRLFLEPDGGIFMTSKSITHESCPEDEECVRCEMHAGGCIVRPTEDSDVFTVMWTGCIDPGGWIPTWIKDTAAWRQSLMIGKFKKFYEEGASMTASALTAAMMVAPCGSSGGGSSSVRH